LIILTGLFGFIAAVLGLHLTLGKAGYPEFALKFFPFLIKAKGKEGYLLFFLIVIIFFGYLSNTAREYLEVEKKPSLQESQDTSGARILKASSTTFQMEVDAAAEDAKARAAKYFDAAECMFQEKEYRDAAENYRRSIQVLPTMSGYLNLGLSQMYITDYSSAKNSFLIGLDIAKSKHEAYQATFLSNLGIIYMHLGNLEKALEYHRLALEIYERLKDALGQANQIGNIGNVHKFLGNLEKALESHQTALQIFRVIENLEGQAIALSNIGSVHERFGNLDESLKFNRQAISLYRKIDNPIGLANALYSTGIIYWYKALALPAGQQKNLLDQAAEAHQEALIIYEKIGNLTGKAKALACIGLITTYRGNEKEGVPILQEALHICDSLDDLDTVSEIHCTIGYVYMNVGRLDEALEYLENARHLSEKIDDPKGKADALLNIGVIYFRKNEKEEAFTILKEAQKICQQYGFKGKSEEIQNTISRFAAES